MQAVGGVDRAVGCGEHALVDHELRSPVALLPGLEHEDDVDREFVSQRTQRRRGAAHRGDVEVVPAGVHRPEVARRVRQTGGLLYREPVHVSAEQDRRLLTAGWLAPTAQHSGHRAQALASGDLEPVEGRKEIEDRLLCGGKRQPDLGALMEFTPQLAQLEPLP